MSLYDGSSDDAMIAWSSAKSSSFKKCAIFSPSLVMDVFLMWSIHVINNSGDSTHVVALPILRGNFLIVLRLL